MRNMDVALLTIETICVLLLLVLLGRQIPGIVIGGSLLVAAAFWHFRLSRRAEILIAAAGAIGGVLGGLAQWVLVERLMPHWAAYVPPLAALANYLVFGSMCGLMSVGLIGAYLRSLARESAVAAALLDLPVASRPIDSDWSTAAGRMLKRVLTLVVVLAIVRFQSVIVGVGTHALEGVERHSLLTVLEELEARQSWVHARTGAYANRLSELTAMSPGRYAITRLQVTADGWTATARGRTGLECSIVVREGEERVTSCPH